jgi:undecaprenyl-diphosphatase
MDQAIFYCINARWTNPTLDLLMAALSNIEIWKPFLAVIILLSLIFGGFKARVCLLSLLVCLLIAEQVTMFLKAEVNRRRPKQVENVRLVQLQPTHPEFLTLFHKPTIRLSDENDRTRSGPSFPSGHMTDNTIIATCLTLFYRRRGALYWIVTGAIGYSRIYLGAHWPSDIAATFFLAVGETLLILVFLELVWRLAARKLKPEFFKQHPTLFANPTR